MYYFEDVLVTLNSLHAKCIEFWKRESWWGEMVEKKTKSVRVTQLLAAIVFDQWGSGQDPRSQHLPWGLDSMTDRRVFSRLPSLSTQTYHRNVLVGLSARWIIANYIVISHISMVVKWSLKPRHSRYVRFLPTKHPKHLELSDSHQL